MPSCLSFLVPMAEPQAIPSIPAVPFAVPLQMVAPMTPFPVARASLVPFLPVLGRPLVVGLFDIEGVIPFVKTVGMTLCLRDLERSVRTLARIRPDIIQLKMLQLDDVAKPTFISQLVGVDVLFANCGPLTALILWLRTVHGLPLRIIRDVQTTGWAPYAFQEFVAKEFSLPGDVCLQMSRYAARLWAQFRGQANDVVFHPMLDCPPPPPMPRVGRRVGFFSRLNDAKGCLYLPQIIHKLMLAGWPLMFMDICGNDTHFGASLEPELQRLGLRVTMYPTISFEDSQRLMQQCDLVLFPSVASVESCGQVVIEALQHGCRVIASDYGVAHDVLTKPFRIPLQPGTLTVPESAFEHPWAKLALHMWDPPTPDNFNNMVPGTLDIYLRTPQSTLAAMRGDGPCERRSSSGPMPAMRIHWEPLAKRSAGDWCKIVFNRMLSMQPTSVDILQPSGAFQSALFAEGFNPAISFTVPSPSESL